MDEKELELLKLICSRGKSGVLEKFLSNTLKPYLTTLHEQKGWITDSEGRKFKKSLIWFEETPEGKRWKPSRAGLVICQGQTSVETSEKSEKVSIAPLSHGERSLLAELYGHAAARNFRLGKKTDYINPDTIRFLVPLKNRRMEFGGKITSLIFSKKSGEATYWLPTLAGRAIYEGLVSFPSGTSIPEEISEDIVEEEIIGEEPETIERPMEPEIKPIKPGHITFWKHSGTENIYENYKEPYMLKPGQQAYAPTWEVALASVKRGMEKGIVTHIIKMSDHPYTIWQNPELTQPFPVVKPDGMVVQAGDANETKVDMVIQALQKKGLSAYKKKSPLTKRNPKESLRIGDIYEDQKISEDIGTDLTPYFVIIDIQPDRSRAIVRAVRQINGIWIFSGETATTPLDRYGRLKGFKRGVIDRFQ